MTQHLFCTFCQLTSDQGKLWCVRAECSAGNFTYFLEAGQRIGEFTVEHLLGTCKTAAFYRASTPEAKLIILKVAHIDHDELDNLPSFNDHLQQDALLLAQFQRYQHPALPRLIWQASRTNECLPYNCTIIDDKLRYYIVLEDMPGILLKPYLRAVRQFPVEQAVWLVIALADLLAYMGATSGVNNVPLPPDIIWIIPHPHYLQPVLLDLGIDHVFVDNLDPVQIKDKVTRLIPVAYIAPEYFQHTVIINTNIYHLGLLTYELLEGKSYFDEEVQYSSILYNNIIQGRRNPFSRSDLSYSLTASIEQATHLASEGRHRSLEVFIRDFYGLVQDYPVKGYDYRLALQSMGILLLLVLVIVGILENV